ncbi:MAG TPA: hypothetical protein VKR38_12800 [Usitatibacter sp.]|nr:hypothetical protein [Usitatibacter sp.]
MTTRGHELVAALAFAASLAAMAADGPRPIEAVISVGAPPVAISPKDTGQSARLSFEAKRGQRLTLVIAGLKMSPASASALLASVRGPGDELVSTAPIRCLASAPDGRCRAEITIAQDGRQSLQLESPFSAIASYSVSLEAIVQKALVLDGDGIDFAAAQPGDITRFSVDVPAGKAFTIAVDKLVHSPDVESNSLVGIFAPDGKRVAFVGCRTHGFEGRPPNPCNVVVPAPGAASHYEVRISTPYGATVAGRLSATSVAQPK